MTYSGKVRAIDLAWALGVLLEEIVPAGIRVRPDGDGLVVLQKQNIVGGAEIEALLDHQPSAANTIDVARTALESLQDVIAETTTQPWPSGAIDPLPEFDVTLERGMLSIVVRTDPPLRLGPIRAEW
jgi:hypothetical protein